MCFGWSVWWSKRYVHQTLIFWKSSPIFVGFSCNKSTKTLENILGSWHRYMGVHLKKITMNLQGVILWHQLMATLLGPKPTCKIPGSTQRSERSGIRLRPIRCAKETTTGKKKKSSSIPWVIPFGRKGLSNLNFLALLRSSNSNQLDFFRCSWIQSLNFDPNPTPLAMGFKPPHLPGKIRPWHLHPMHQFGTSGVAQAARRRVLKRLPKRCKTHISVHGTGLFTYILASILSSWWLNQPIWKICSSNWKSSPNRGEN